MPASQLTRHLYREDEVRSSLMYCILRGRMTEAIFWCMELLDSGLADPLLASIRKIWLLGFAGSAAKWFVEFQGGLAAQEWIDYEALVKEVACLCRLSKAQRDTTALLLLSGGWASAAAAGVSLSKAVQEGKVTLAWDLCCKAEGKAGLAAILEEKHGERGTTFWATLEEARRKGELQPLQALAAALSFGCLSVEEAKQKWDRPLVKDIPKEVQEEIEGWRAVIGRRNRRAFSVPMETLYWLTGRGRDKSVYETTEKDIMGRLDKPSGIWGSEYWDEVAEEYGGWLAIRQSDEVREKFYDEQFPDDVPDEWPRKERAKSHGPGVLQKGGAATLGDWVRRWFTGIESPLIKGGVERAVKVLKGRGEAAIKEGVEEGLIADERDKDI